MKRIKKIFIIILVLISVLSLTGCQKKESAKKLVLATEAGFAPYEYYKNGKIVGVDIDIVNEIAKELGYELEIKDVAFDSIINEVKTSKSDIGAAGISYTKERAEEVDFSVNYAESRQIIVVKDDSTISSPNDLSGKKISVQLGSTADSYLTENYNNISLVREKKFLAAIQDLKDDKVDCVVMDEVPARELVSPGLKILSDPVTTDSYGMIVKKGNTKLLNVTNRVIKRLKKEGKIDKYLLNHMGVKKDNSKKSITNSFYKSVIYDGRYKYILEGLKNTLIIALGAVIIGIILGTLLSVVRNFHDHTGNLKLLNLFSKIYITVIRGTPSILQLMIIYYVIFKQTSVNIVIVGILAFGINSAAYVAEIIRAGLNSVDRGQLEAGYSLGLSYRQIISHIIFPQAIKNILPALGNEFITLVKETSVGAYIGIVELTKASDIIASRTYDYFFPLILIAIIYLLITFILSKVFSMLERKMNNA